ncbi:phosphotransferase family protein [Niallia endozanthoxylica]|uniref:Phosphotransferase family protein n=1 Tax=Niallia endozanthoxylica TaxID=2036016 RepID=A0A5J5I1N1_9BACI|nr:phosphotransferase family protein [Niallia endozanthoxylica]KAA9027454.1 phosphotransferase family protein [Niallia endozanthoxylica]
MEHFFGQDWEIVPAGGATGEAFYAQHEENQYFLKRNTSPFLASLSAEGIVPKLVWTKRLETGDVFTAQQWLNGRELQPSEMNRENVAKLLRKIHLSKPLLSMLKRLGKTPVQPIKNLQAVKQDLDDEILNLDSVKASLKFLENHVNGIHYENTVVCHCDVNHNNWLLDENNQLYLIDWDGAVVGDPAIDIGTLLYWYIPRNEWEKWLNLYGLSLDNHLLLRMKWYVIAQTLTSIQWHKDKARLDEMNKEIDRLHQYLSL